MKWISFVHHVYFHRLRGTLVTSHVNTCTFSTYVNVALSTLSLLTLSFTFHDSFSILPTKKFHNCIRWFHIALMSYDVLILSNVENQTSLLRQISLWCKTHIPIGGTLKVIVIPFINERMSREICSLHVLLLARHRSLQTLILLPVFPAIFLYFRCFFHASNFPVERFVVLHTTLS